MLQSSCQLSSLKNDELRSAVPKPGDEISFQMPVSRTQEFPSFPPSCFQKVFALLSWFTIYGDLLHLFFSSLGDKCPICHVKCRNLPCNAMRSQRGIVLAILLLMGVLLTHL